MKGLIYGALSVLLAGTIAVSTVRTASADTPIARLIPAEASLPGGDIPSSATHHIALTVQAAKLSQLVIRFPADITPPVSVQVTNQADELIETKVAIDQQKAVINFTHPVAMGTTLKVALKGVKRVTSANVVVYEVAARRTGDKGFVPIGSASVRAYGPAQ